MTSDPGAFRAEFPALERVAYMNAGSEGPVPRAAADAARARIELETTDGRCGRPYMDSIMELASELRSGYAEVLGCQAEQVALTGSTTNGVNTVISGLDLQAGEEILTSDEEHPGLLAPLGMVRRRRGVSVRVVPFAEVARAVSSATRLIACSHVSWVSGRVIEIDELTSTGVPVLLDGAQGLGAVALDVKQSRVDFYAGSGQKWLCGPEGSGCLYVRDDRLEELAVPWPGYGSLETPEDALEARPKAGAARFDHGFPSGMRSAWALASLSVLRDADWSWVHERAASLAASLAEGLASRGVEVGPRGRSTLVSWRAADPQAEVQRLAESGIAVRSIPSFDFVRASVGAWSSEDELERLVELAAL